MDEHIVIKKKKTRYNQFEHVLHRPDTYIGAVETKERPVELYFEKDEEAETEDKERFSTLIIPFSNGLFHIIKEIGSNAIDNKWKSESEGYKQTYVKIDCDLSVGKISFTNDGKPIPVEKKISSITDYRTGKEITEELYYAQEYFGEMLAGTNFDDDGEKRKTSGRNGIGSKATNVFSTSFEIDHSDGKHRFYQLYENNATVRHPPEITRYKKRAYTQISFVPDYERFGYPGLDENLIGALKRYAHEMSMVMKGIPVFFTEKFEGEEKTQKIQVKNLNDYAALYYPGKKRIHLISPADGGECVIVETEPNSTRDELDGPQHVSFVNGIRTLMGGPHVDIWSKTLFLRLVKAYNAGLKDKSKIKVESKYLYPYFKVFVRFEAENPKFTSQTKDEMTEPSVITMAKDEERWSAVLKNAIEKIMKWGFVSSLKNKMALKEEATLKKKENDSLGACKKYTKANWSTDRSKYTTIPLTLCVAEGDSAKGLVISIRAAKDLANTHGVFAIRGKFINAKTHTLDQISKNKEVGRIKKIIGLKFGVDYSDDEAYKNLRYKHLSMWADADDDGIHIDGLMMNFIQEFWPALFNRGFFVIENSVIRDDRVKPITGGPLQTVLFYSQSERDRWWEENRDRYELVQSKYLKGLGSIAPADAETYFENSKQTVLVSTETSGEKLFTAFDDEYSRQRALLIAKHHKPPSERSHCVLVGKTRPIHKSSTPSESSASSRTRRTWRNEDIDEDGYNYDGQTTIDEFVDSRLIIFWQRSLIRAIPNMMDGFNDARRKVYYGIQKKKLKMPYGVNKLHGFITEVSAYHHGESSLIGTIIGMAQGFVGSNNIALLKNDGQFGTRLQGGKDASAARYIATCLEKITSKLFIPTDNHILPRNVDSEDMKIEHKFYIPILPMCLVNGTEAIATGFRTYSPGYNPLDLVEWIETWLRSRLPEAEEIKTQPTLVPWYRGFKGKIYLTDDGKGVTRWVSEGIINQDSKGVWHVTEAPVGLWTDNLKGFLDELESGSTETTSKRKTVKKIPVITGLAEYNTSNSVNMQFKAKRGFVPSIDGNFKILRKAKKLGQLVVLDKNCYPRKYQTPEDFLQDFCRMRIRFYKKRLAFLVKSLEFDLKRDEMKYRYIRAVRDGQLNMKQSSRRIEEDMLVLGLEKMPPRNIFLEEVEEPTVVQTNTIDEEKQEKVEKSYESFDYLLDMAIKSLTEERYKDLKRAVEKTKEMIKGLKQKTPEILWLEDLEEFRKAYPSYLSGRVEEITMKRKKKAK